MANVERYDHSQDGDFLQWRLSVAARRGLQMGRDELIAALQCLQLMTSEMMVLPPVRFSGKERKLMLFNADWGHDLFLAEGVGFCTVALFDHHWVGVLCVRKVSSDQWDLVLTGIDQGKTDVQAWQHAVSRLLGIEFSKVVPQLKSGNDVLSQGCGFHALEEIKNYVFREVDFEFDYEPVNMTTYTGNPIHDTSILAYLRVLQCELLEMTPAVPKELITFVLQVRGIFLKGLGCRITSGTLSIEFGGFSEAYASCRGWYLLSHLHYCNCAIFMC